MNGLVVKKDIIAKYLLQLTISVTIFSQISAVADIFRPIMYLLWLLMVSYLGLSKVGKMKVSSFTATFLFCYTLFALYCLIRLSVDSDYEVASYLQLMLVPLLVSIVSDLLDQKLTKADLILICKNYVVCSLIFAVYINFTFFSSYQAWLDSNSYLFASKNSAAQIWCTAMLIIYYVILPVAKRKYLWYASIFYLLILCGLSQCRTAILGLACVLIFNILMHSKHKVKWMLVLCLSLGGLLFLSETRQFISQAFLIDKYAGADINTLSSGRLGLYVQALDNFIESPILGVGRYYVDCSYIYILAESGIIGFLLIEFIWLKRIVLNLKHKYSPYARPYMLTSFVIFYFIESLLEGQPPFGPGVSSFMFWMLSEIKVGDTIG